MNGLLDSIIQFAQELIAIPSQGGIDSCETIIKSVVNWLDSRMVPCKVQFDSENNAVGLAVEIVGKKSGPTYCLNACLDTAPFGDLSAWEYPPLSGELVENWLYGRGSADSKIAVSIFSHLAIRLLDETHNMKGNLSILFDGDEHTGRFGGIKSFVASHPDISGVMVGYPGNYGIIVGSRGFYRTKISVYGSSMHSGTTKQIRENAVQKAAMLIQEIYEISLPEELHPDFKFGPSLNVTAVNGGQGYSTIPDLCSVLVDVRLTPSFTPESASLLLHNVASEVDRKYPTKRSTVINEQMTWPAYRLSDTSLVALMLHEAAEHIWGRKVPWVVSGPSNIGNYLAYHHIDATAGHGASYENIHAQNECVDITTIQAVHDIYLRAIHHLLFDKKPMSRGQPLTQDKT